jgi:hypothetical protein
MRYSIILFLACILAYSSESRAQFDSTRIRQDSDSSHQVNWSRVAVTTGSLTAAIAGLHIYQSNAWWDNNRAPFHVFEDADYQADYDKVGHMFGSYYSSFFFDQAYLWAGMDSVQATTFGALSGALWEYYVEIEDGFAQAWGFSRGDAKSDITGAAFYLANQRVPFLRDFRYKWFYFPTTKLTQNQPDIPGQGVTFIEDYGGQTYYLRADIHSMLPDNMKPYWPSWLNLAVAVSGYDINSADLNSPSGNPFDMRRKAWYISLDYDIDKIFPESSSGILNFLRQSWGYWHFPAPALRLYPSPHFFLTFPVSFSIDHGLHLTAEPSLGGK